MSTGDEKQTVKSDVADDSLSDALDAALKATRKPIETSKSPSSDANSTEEQSRRKLADRLGLPFVSLHDYEFDEEALVLVPAEFARNNNVIPLRLKNPHLLVAMANPMQQDIYQSLGFITGLHVDIAVASLKDVQWAVQQYYGIQDDELALESMDNHDEPAEEQELERLGSERPIVRLVSNIIRDAIDRKASDIHIRPREKNVELIYRLNGTLTTIRFFSKSLLAAVVSRIKILGGMDIAERRVPQDGRSCVRSDNYVVDMRISIMPTVEGESVVIRLLNANVGLKSVSELGFSKHDEDVFRDLLHKSNGIFLVTGPTGSGKSTTLYAALGEVQKQNVNIITVEDPVEYHMDGIEQIQINHATGYTFARALRNILRHDPDVILVGEIRDQETGKIAVESALTGHLVLSTLHTNDAAGAITRLLEMGVEPYLLNGSLLGVLAQRLVKKNCPHCLAVEPVDHLIRESLNVPLDEQFYYGTGCDHCDHTGVSGRMAVYELLRVNDAIRDIIQPNVATTAIYEQALAEGMVPLTDNALARARTKEISLAETYRIRLN
ncbi:MAG: GspE/PulE family protein [Gammaproteobacteria bacterium]|nr:GspE/PulE family protein [Gammaproteobacteria bacterium]